MFIHFAVGMAGESNKSSNENCRHKIHFQTCQKDKSKCAHCGRQFIFVTLFSGTVALKYKVDQKLQKLVTGREEYPMQRVAAQLKLPRMCSKHSAKILLSQRDSVMRYRDFCERVLVDPCKFIEFLFSNPVFGQIMATPVLKVEQRYTIKFCCHLRKPATGAYNLIKQAYGDEALAQATVFRWHQVHCKKKKCRAHSIQWPP